jgi:16S rRNA (cytidine1402-2'-O)-methyltransferase
MSERIERGALYIVSTPIGNLGDISLRARHILEGVDLVAAEDTRTTGNLLKHLSLSKPLLSYFTHNERRRIPELISRLRAGESIALVSDAGTPGISDPAFAIAREAIAEGIRIIPIPGASALLSALVVSGLPMDRFVFEGFLPVKKGRRSRLARLKGEERTIVLYESPHRIRRTLQDLCDALGDRSVAVAREMTKKFEEVTRGPLREVISKFERQEPRGEFVVVIAGAGHSGAGEGRDTSSDEENRYGEDHREEASSA